MRDALTADLFADVTRKARRRAWLAPAPMLVVFAAFVIVMTILQPPGAEQLVSYALNIGSLFVLLLVFGFLMQYLAGRGVRRLAPLKPRVREADLPLRGLAFVLENGLLVLFVGSGVFLTSFFDANGSPMHPRLQEALQWTGGRRLKMVKIVRTGLGPAAARVDLEGMRDRLGASFCLAAVSEPRAASHGAGDPRWVVSINVFRFLGGPKVDRLASQIDEIESFLRRFLQASVAGCGVLPGGPVPSSPESRSTAASPGPSSAFPRWRMALSIIAIAALPALLVAAFLWPDLAGLFLTIGIVLIFVVATIGAKGMGSGRVRTASSVPGIRYLIPIVAVSVFTLTIAFETTVLSLSLLFAVLDAVFWTAVITVATAAGLRKFLSPKGA